MVGRIRVFKGATELNVSTGELTKTNDQIVNSVTIEIEAESTIINSTVLDFTKEDGSTPIFSARVQRIERPDQWKITAYSDGYELMGLWVEKVYTTTSPEAIVADIIGMTQNLTYASTATSGFTITEYKAREYAIDTIKTMMDLLQWQIRIDSSGNFYFEPKGNIDSGVTFTNGENIQVLSWDDDPTEMMNKIKVIGGFENFATQETITATGTEFTLSNKPVGAMRATISGTEQDPDTYTVDAENKKITFTGSKTNPTFYYTYARPVVVSNQDDESINQYTEIYKEVPAPWLNSLSDARKYVQNLLDVYSRPFQKVQGMTGGLNFDVEVGEIVTVIDTIRNRSGQFIITKITYDFASLSTRLSLGPRDFVLFDWQRETESRIKKLEQRSTNQDISVLARTFKENVNVSLLVEQTFEYASPQDTAWMNHQTLGQLRTVANSHIDNMEPDCSGNVNDGVWYGSSINGSQFSTSGWRLSCGNFNGTDNYVQVEDDATLDLSADISIAIAVKVSSLPGSTRVLVGKYDGTDGYYVALSNTGIVSLVYRAAGATSTISAVTALGTGEFKHYVFTKSGTALKVYVNGIEDNTGTGGATIGTNNVVLYIGRYSTLYFAGTLDEIRIYSTGISAATANNIYLKLQENTNLVGYWAFDCPKLGLNISARQTVV